VRRKVGLRGSEGTEKERERDNAEKQSVLRGAEEPKSPQCKGGMWGTRMKRGKDGCSYSLGGRGFQPRRKMRASTGL
jgi:hypothetical protein